MGEVSYVAQDNFLFDESIRENIRLGKPDATDDEVVAAAKAACCHDFIVNLENGYDTNAGDAGEKLSGGERQRITIARAILKNARVIILDEATAYADPENEYLIQSAISKLVKRKNAYCSGSSSCNDPECRSNPRGGKWKDCRLRQTERASVKMPALSKVMERLCEFSRSSGRRILICFQL